MINNKNEILNEVLDKELLDYDKQVKQLVQKEKEDCVFHTNNIVTPLACVSKMFSYLPANFWNKDDKSILDPCAGFGNFEIYLKAKHPYL